MYLFYYHINIQCLHRIDAKTANLQQGLKYKCPKDIMDHPDHKSN